MPDESKELQFKLTTVAELRGATDLATSLERQIGAAKALKQDYSQLQAQLNTVTASIKESEAAIVQQTQAFDKAAYEAQVSQEEIDKLSRSHDASASAAERSGVQHRALRETMMRLNMLIPGLGDALHFMSEAYSENTAAAGEAEAANESMVASMGVLAVAFLTIQAATTWWQFFKEGSNAAAEAFTKDSQEISEAAKKAFDAVKKLQDALSGKSESPTKKYETELEDRQKILEAEQRQQQSARENAEQEALAGATTPEQRDAIKRRFEDEKAKAAVQDQADTAEQQAEVMKEAQADLDKRRAKIEADKKALAQMPVSDYAGRTGAMDNIAKEADQAASLADYINGLKNNVQTGQQVNAIDQETWQDKTKSNARTTFEQAVQAGLATHGQKISTDQQTALDLMNQLFQSLGGSFHPVLEYLKTAHLNQQQFQAYVAHEIEMLKQAQAKIHNDANASY